jgi:hypothetical protein
VCEHNGVELAPGAAAHLRKLSRELGDGDLRPYLPGSVCKILISICTFESLPLVLDPPMIERVAHLYFTHTDDRGREIPVAAHARPLVTIPTGSRGDDEVPHQAHQPEAPAPAGAPAPGPGIAEAVAAAAARRPAASGPPPSEEARRPDLLPRRDPMAGGVGPGR